MRKRIVWALLAVLLLTVLDFSSAENETAHFKVGGNLELRPPSTGRISNILWKFNGDLIVEWVDEIVPLDYYGRFKGRTTLDTTTGVLVMKNLEAKDEGLYTVEINNKVLPKQFIGKAIEGVPKPQVWKQPLSCNSESASCTLRCEKGNGDIAKAEPITYEWKEDNGKWQEKGITITISQTDTGIKTFTCKMKNPVSEEESDPVDNVFYKEPPPADLGLAVGLPVCLLLLLAAAAAAGFFYIKKRGSNAVNGHNHTSPSDGNPGNTEDVPLKTN